MKYVPNIITCIRVLFSVVLLFLKPLSISFYLIYTVCGLSDIFDGYIARTTNNISKIGAALDSTADIIFISAMLYILIPIIPLQTWVIIWIVGIAITRILSIFIGYVKYKTLTSLHTYGNKATGLLLFLFPYIYQVFGITHAANIILIIASLSAMEELLIIIITHELNVNIKSLFIK